MRTRFIDGLELVSAEPEATTDWPPLLFVHGAFAGAWCWAEHYLDFFAGRGWAAHALSLTGHGKSRGRERLDHLSIADYVADVAKAAKTLPRAPVVIGHSMGGFVVQKYLEEHAAPAAVLLCAVPPQGLAGPTVSLLMSKPRMLIDFNRLLLGHTATIESLREALFAQPISPAALVRYLRLSQPESHRALWDMMFFALPRPRRVLAHLPHGPRDLLVVGAARDVIIPPSQVEMTARAYAVGAVIHPAVGHGLMLESGWEKPAQHLARWLEERFSLVRSA